MRAPVPRLPGSLFMSVYAYAGVPARSLASLTRAPAHLHRHKSGLVPRPPYSLGALKAGQKSTEI
jgi:hypothetical protein